MYVLVHVCMYVSRFTNTLAQWIATTTFISSEEIAKMDQSSGGLGLRRWIRSTVQFSLVRYGDLSPPIRLA